MALPAHSSVRAGVEGGSECGRNVCVLQVCVTGMCVWNVGISMCAACVRGQGVAVEGECVVCRVFVFPCVFA